MLSVVAQLVFGFQDVKSDVLCSPRINVQINIIITIKIKIIKEKFSFNFV